MRYAKRKQALRALGEVPETLEELTAHLKNQGPVRFIFRLARSCTAPACLPQWAY